MGNEGDCICTAQERMQWLSLLNVAVNLMFHCCCRNFLKSVSQENFVLFIWLVM
jgi:hypothetical protein